MQTALDNHSQLQLKTCVIHCICNSVNTRLVDEAAACGARTPACVMKHCNTRFNCGQCIPSIAERLEVVTGLVDPAPARVLRTPFTGKENPDFLEAAE